MSHDLERVLQVVVHVPELLVRGKELGRSLCDQPFQRLVHPAYLTLGGHTLLLVQHETTDQERSDRIERPS
ncbi:MAG: hypothetical protein ACYCX5_08680 [Coriobacteriia bacterium]